MRKTQPVTITAEGRDKGKLFLLTEMAAVPAEKWATRVFLALIESGVDIPDHIVAAGMEGLVSEEGIGAILKGILSGAGKMRWNTLEPLLDEMLECVRVVPEPVANPDFSRPINLNADDIEEVKTLLALRKEILALHTGFSFAAKPSTSKAPAASLVAPITKISHRSSGR